jgi:hypothetical protein
LLSPKSITKQIESFGDGKMPEWTAEQAFEVVTRLFDGLSGVPGVPDTTKLAFAKVMAAAIRAGRATTEDPKTLLKQIFSDVETVNWLMEHGEREVDWVDGAYRLGSIGHRLTNNVEK